MPDNVLASRERATARRATLPLALMAAVFLLPTYRACGDGAFERPVDFVDGAWMGFWIVPVFVGAAMLAIFTAHVLVRASVGFGTRRLALAVLAIVALSSVATGLAMAMSSSGRDWPFVVLAAVAAFLATLVVRRGRGLSPWRIWEHLLLAFAIAAAGSGPSVFLAFELAGGSRKDLGPGAYLYLGSLVALLLITSRALRREDAGARHQ